MLRRKKTDLVDGKPLLHLPARNVRVITCEFDAGERAFYDALEGKLQEVLERLLQQSGGRAYMSALLLLLRLRQGGYRPTIY
jgi:SNF2 family DNA or RNA helicase